MVNNYRKPSLRFMGFTEEWEKRKVEELLIERNEKAPMNDEYPLMAFIANEGVAPKGERYDRSSLVSDVVNKLYKRTEFGDFIYSSNNLETGSIGLNKHGNASISPVYSIFRQTEIADSDFLGRRLARKDFISSMVKWRQGVVYGQWRIHESDFKKIEIYVPCVNEQRKIGKVLDVIDKIINLKRRKFEKIVSVKNTLLVKMIPQNGESFPRIRFNQFKETFEKHALWALTSWDKNFNEVEREKQSKVIKYPYVLAEKLNSLEDNNGKVLLLSTGTYVGFTTEEKAGNYLCEGEVVAIPWGGTPNIKYWKGKFVTADNRIATSTDTQRLLNKYLFYWMNSQIKNIEKTYRGASIKHPSMYDVLNMEIRYPKANEQEKISSILSLMDNLISLNLLKLEKLENLKKSLLYKLFL